MTTPVHPAQPDTAPAEPPAPRALWRILLTPRWLGVLLLGVAMAVAFYYLGQWQWHRYEYKAARADRIAAHYDAPPVPVREVIGNDPLPLAREWTKVEFRGTYLAEKQVMVRNRPQEKTYGYEVLVPLRTADGIIMVDRGWVQNSDRGAEVTPDVPAAPSGTVTITGWAKPDEASRGKDLPAGQVASINLADVEGAIGLDVLGGYVILEGETTTSGTTPERPTPLLPPDDSLGPHMAYAFQWWGAMPVPFILMWFGMRREQRDGQPVSASAKPKKVRIWDEEDD
ncbi:SURF1 family cytochrome oxidase biogenesis protein [Kribbia dieselivorans]|uniref:SURF1 family cytochrome oxidase biogenesis protein n=1 Tax=Kribbia dieselivorans TaxID=331526 RepID=UPI0009FA611F|nr:SURF1 family protein [Kribbia dieselivorans]